MSFLIFDNAAGLLQYDQLTQLEGSEYLFRFKWHEREACYYAQIFDQNENPIALAIKLVINTPLLRRFKDPRLPAGLLFCVDLTEQNREIATPEDFGTRVELVYLTADDPLLAK